ncbi:unnamed protein product [Adineta ricciae]|uniref:Alternative oxidase n=1 Tax=Adineta ricciae TaxID=249248 RepID=A0A813PYT7_ADIRI|nr:unnamed protein product [Adineta ricciae]
MSLMIRTTNLVFHNSCLTSTTAKCVSQLASIQPRGLLHTSSSLMNEEKECRQSLEIKQLKDYMMHHEIYSEKDLQNVTMTHKKLESWHDRVAYAAVRTLRLVFDTFTGYLHGSTMAKLGYQNPSMTEEQWLRRFIFLETVAGVPGMVGGMTRHMKSLRTMHRDYGWIHTLLSEAENERMHLLTFLELRQPGWIFRSFVLLGQGVFFNAFFLSYLLSPKTCHRFVGFLEEEAVITYTRCLQDLDAGKLPAWTNLPAPTIARNYWKLSDNAMLRDVLLAVRADEATHRQVNHKLADVGPNAPNPFLVEEKQIIRPPSLDEQRTIDTANKN